MPEFRGDDAGFEVEFEFRLRAGERVYVLPRGEVCLGRDGSCFIQLEGDLVSRRHAIVEVRPDKLVFRDLGSSNGSRVNEALVEEPIELRAGDRIRIGWVLLEVEAIAKRRQTSPTLRLVHCDACGAIVAEHMQFCVQCGHRLPSTAVLRRCRGCGRELSARDLVCSHCGIPVFRRGGEPRD